MVTFNQLARSYGRAVRAAERDRKRQAREAAILYKEQQRQQALADAARAVKQYENYLNAIQSLHCSAMDPIEWEHIEAAPAPPYPERKNTHELKAVAVKDAFRPGFFDDLFGHKRKLARMEKAIEKGRETDEAEYQTAETIHREWRENKELATRILAKDIEAYKQAIQDLEPFSDMAEIGSHLEFEIGADHIEVKLFVKGEEVIPTEALSLTKTGKLSRKQMPQGKFNELYQDYVCSALLRVARDLLSMLPVKAVLMHAMTEQVNTANGHLEPVAIVSVLIRPETLDKLNLDQIDPSDSMRNFLHAMNFKKTTGFKSVEPVTIPDLE